VQYARPAAAPSYYPPHADRPKVTFKNKVVVMNECIN